MKRRTIASVLLFAALLLSVVAGTVGAAGAGYYNNSSSVVDNDTGSNANASTILDKAVGLLPQFVGVGEQDPSGTGLQGALLVGIVYAGVTLAMMMGTQMGPIAGSILGIATSYGLVAAGYAPIWMLPLLLFGLGIIAFVAFRRVFR